MNISGKGEGKKLKQKNIYIKCETSDSRAG